MILSQQRNNMISQPFPKQNFPAFSSADDEEPGCTPAEQFPDDDNFRMYVFKIKKCPVTRPHDWTQCPFAHPGERARRRCPVRFNYSATPCPDFKRNACRRGDACEFAHGVFEVNLHPSRYRTSMCTEGTACTRKICFFAHTPSKLRVVEGSGSPPSPPGSPNDRTPTSGQQQQGGANGSGSGSGSASVVGGISATLKHAPQQPSSSSAAAAAAAMPPIPNGATPEMLSHLLYLHQQMLMQQKAVLMSASMSGDQSSAIAAKIAVLEKSAAAAAAAAAPAPVPLPGNPTVPMRVAPPPPEQYNEQLMSAVNHAFSQPVNLPAKRSAERAMARSHSEMALDENLQMGQCMVDDLID